MDRLDPQRVPWRPTKRGKKGGWEFGLGKEKGIQAET